LGYIKLNAPVTHLWYLKTNPSYLSIFFDMKKKDLEAVVYCTDSLTLENVWKYKEQKTNFYHSSINDLYMSWQKLRNLEEKKHNFEKHFFNEKQKKVKDRKKLLSPDLFFSNKIQIKQSDFSQKKENLSPVQFRIFQKIQKQKQQILLFSLFEKVFEKNLKKVYGNNVLKRITKEFFLANQNNKKIKKAEKNLFFPNSFFDFSAQNFGNENFSEKKNTKKLFVLFFFLFHFSNSLVLHMSHGEKSTHVQDKKKRQVFTKRNLFFLLNIVSFLKKWKTFENFLSHKKQNKKSNFIYQLQQFGHLFSNSKHRIESDKKRNDSSLMTSADAFFNFELSTFLNIKRTQFLSYSFVNSPQKFLFAHLLPQGEKKKDVHPPGLCPGGKAVLVENKNMFLPAPAFFKKKTPAARTSSRTITSNQIPMKNFKNTLQKEKSTFRVFNKFLDSQNKRLSQKKQKKQREFSRSGFLLETLEKEIKSKEKENKFSFQQQKISTHTKMKKSLNFSQQTLFKTKHQKNESAFFKKKTSTLQVSRRSSKFLKNPVVTMSYNFLWKNDSDWKYFVYYNSLFFSEFEDIPILDQTQWGEQNENFQNWRMKPFSDEKNESLYSYRAVDENLQKQTQVGAGILEKLLTEYTPPELKKMIKQHQILLPKINQVIHSSKQMGALSKKESLKIQKYIQKREHIVRRLKFLRKFFRKNSNPTFMILRNLPVLPPDLRPILKLQNQIAASDLNRFYQRIIYRNERLKKFSKDSATNQSFELRYAQRLLQEAVDNLIQNGKGGVKPETNSRGIPLKSLSEILKGKQGRFRQYLLGKRVDYSGRSVIVVGPQLKLYECGLPKEMAFELFLPFLIQQILQLNLAKTVIGAKNLLKRDSNFAFHLLKKIMKNIPVLLNRAPTLHRLGFQAFLPKLIEGRAILLHPMVCPGFNADFDGDQMAVHVPLTVEARTEAWKFMLSTNNFINSATGDPVLLPTQDMVLGCYYLTTDFHSKSAAVQILNALRKEKNTKFYDFQTKNKNFLFFSNFSDVFSAYQRKEISLHSPIWIRWNGFVDFGNDSTKPVEIQVRKNGSWLQIQPKRTTFSSPVGQKNEIFSQFIRTTPGRIFMNFMIQEFQKKNRIE
jgi:DNA-directed RNA polymerase beta' subunit